MRLFPGTKPYELLGQLTALFNYNVKKKITEEMEGLKIPSLAMTDHERMNGGEELATRNCLRFAETINGIPEQSLVVTETIGLLENSIGSEEEFWIDSFSPFWFADCCSTDGTSERRHRTGTVWSGVSARSLRAPLYLLGTWMPGASLGHLFQGPEAPVMVPPGRIRLSNSCWTSSCVQYVLHVPVTCQRLIA